MEIRQPIIIAGPCSVESHEQLMATVENLGKIPQVQMIRCGVWKPRTHPGGFEGLGEEALQWMDEAKTLHPGVRFCCEVGLPEHVETALRHGIDTVWIGARTSANPFLVQEVTEALRGTATTVLVKNAPSPDVELWAGAIERCWKVGLTHLMAVHRGFEMLRNQGYRNTPLWEVPIELRRRMPQVPILCDPSHVAGRRDLILELSQTALDLGFDGLMIEVHPQPEAAITDKQQQISPAALLTLLSQLVVRQTDTESAEVQLSMLRQQIDQLDNQLLQVCADRFNVVRQIADVKRKGNIAIFQPKRWDSLLQDHIATGTQMGLKEEFVKELFEKIHTESIRVQRDEP